MIWKIFTQALSTDTQPATGTYPDGFYHLLARHDLAHERDRHFRESYGRDYLLARTLDSAPPAFG